MNRTIEPPRGPILRLPELRAAPTVLIVDEDRELTSLLTFVLEREGFEVQSAEPETALRRPREEQPDVAIVNLEGDAGPGFDSLRAMCSRLGIPVLFLSNEGEGSGVLQGLDGSVVEYLSKPFSERQLVHRLRAAIARAARTTASNGQENVAAVRVSPVYSPG